MTFEETGLESALLSSLKDLGFETPTPIQEQAIPFVLNESNDLIALAQTGTGKTAAFGLPMIQQTNIQDRFIQSLILCPTRELALQIADDLSSYGKHKRGIKTVAVYGGANIDKQIRQINSGAHIIVGTPGRTLDLINRGNLRINDINMLVLDEADEMLDRGFKHDLDAILSTTPRDKRTLLFSATMPEEISRIASEYLYDPKQIKVGKLNAGSENIEHEYFIQDSKGRYQFLKEVLKGYGEVYGIVFCRTKRKTREVARRLSRDGFRAAPIEGDMSQNGRDKVMNNFRRKQVKILVATDVAARGVDVDDLTHIVNFNLPDEDAVYIHRSGRTGRAGKSGISASIISPDEKDRIPGLEQLSRKKFTRRDLDNIPAAKKESKEAWPEEPSEDFWPEQLQDSQVRDFYNLADKVMGAEVTDPKLITNLAALEEYLASYSREDLIRQFMAFAGGKKNSSGGNSRRNGSGNQRHNNQKRYSGRSRS